MNTNYPDNLKILYPKQEIEVAVIRLAAEITREYQARNPLILGVLKGSFIFMSDLVRRLEFPLETDFMQLSSYSRGTESSGKIKISHDLKSPVSGQGCAGGGRHRGYREQSGFPGGLPAKEKPGVFAVLLFTG